MISLHKIVTSITLANYFLCGLQVWNELRVGEPHVAMNSRQLSANSQLGTESLIRRELNFANNHVSVQADPSPVKLLDEKDPRPGQRPDCRSVIEPPS